MRKTNKRNNTRTFKGFLTRTVSGTAASIRGTAKEMINRQIAKQHEMMLAKYVF